MYSGECMAISKKSIASIANILRNCTAQMNRSVEILQILRGGMETMLQNLEHSSVRYTRIFNFDEKRVGLRMEVSENGQAFLPMGRIDVLELPTNNGRVTCSCTLTELQTGNTQRIILRLKNNQEREKECEKVFSFFRKILSIQGEPPSLKPSTVHTDEQAKTPQQEGFPLDSRGAHRQSPKED